MQTKDVALGGGFIALYIAVNYMFPADIKQIQTIVIILKILIIAYYSYHIKIQAKVTFGLTLMLISLILLPISIAVIYNVPSIILGLFLGTIIKWNRKKTGWLLYVVLNTVFLIYEICLYQIFFEVNVLLVYMSYFSNKENLEMLGVFNDMRILLILYLLFDSFFSASFTYLVTYRFINKYKHLQKNFI